jgi:hypothetical protein
LDTPLISYSFGVQFLNLKKIETRLKQRIPRTVFINQDTMEFNTTRNTIKVSLLTTIMDERKKSEMLEVRAERQAYASANTLLDNSPTFENYCLTTRGISRKDLHANGYYGEYIQDLTKEYIQERSIIMKQEFAALRKADQQNKCAKKNYKKAERCSERIAKLREARNEI